MPLLLGYAGKMVSRARDLRPALSLTKRLHRSLCLRGNGSRNGRAGGTRTRDLLSPRQVRWLLRYSPMNWSPHEVTLLGLPIINRWLCF